MTADISAALILSQSRPVAAPRATADESAARKAASQFEAVFISQVLGSIFEGVSTDGPFGGGQGEAMFRSLMLDEYSQRMEAQGGIGLSPVIARQLLHLQEANKRNVRA